MINTKNKKKYFIAILASIIIFMILMFVVAIRKIEAPKIEDKTITAIPTTETVVKSEGATTIPLDKAETINANKYKIIARSVIMPEDKTNKKKIVLLTIDDGPSIRTKEMIDILEKHNAKAIFFINGMHDKDNIGVIKEINDRGFAVGSHTWSHLNLKREKDITKIEKEINKNTDLIKNETGSNPRFFRAPYGESNQSIRDLVKKDGMLFMDWSGAVKDWEKSTQNEDVFIQNATHNLHSGTILLIHEHPWSIANMEALLTKLESLGYTYVDPKDIIE